MIILTRAVCVWLGQYYQWNGNQWCIKEAFGYCFSSSYWCEDYCCHGCQTGFYGCGGSWPFYCE
jgi:hypothetical protein